MAVLRAGGIDDAISEQLIMDVMIGTNSLANVLMIKVGTVSREHDFAGDSLISLRISPYNIMKLYTYIYSLYVSSYNNKEQIE